MTALIVIGAIVLIVAAVKLLDKLLDWLGGDCA